MIGVVADADELEWVAEFFELFKTPWEPAQPGRSYDAVLISSDDAGLWNAPLLLVYGADERAIDRQYRTGHHAWSTSVDLQWNGETIPIYGRLATFGTPGENTALRAGSEAADSEHREGTTRLRRIGYDLFAEVRHLLTRGQDKTHAETATLELHIELIRTYFRNAHIPYIEIPPRPHGSSFVCCLTHDIDFFGVRRHKADATLAGFLARGALGTLLDVLRGRRPLDELFRNWAAILSLPFVWLGLRRDFWHPFEDYRDADSRHPSTFFLIPFKGRAGVGNRDVVHPQRAAPYGIRDISDEIQTASDPSVEFAVHGIDAWHDARSGAMELRELTEVTGQPKAGVRMHWLYFSDTAPHMLEEAGFAYDSSWGYNDAVGFRAGTAQAFRLSATQRLLELPLTIMDTALFYPSRMGLDRVNAMTRCRDIIRQAQRFGGAVVINWHDRSLAPERQWGRPYRELLAAIPPNAWFATAGQAVSWFTWRRSVRFSADRSSGSIRIEAGTRQPDLPAAVVVVQRHGQETKGEELLFDGESQTVLL